MQIARRLTAVPVLIAALATGPAVAADVDFSRFLASPAGAAGVAAAVSGLGRCDSPLSWGHAYDEERGTENPDHLFVGCTYVDTGDGETYEKSVIARFNFWENGPVLDSLTYLP